MIAGKLNETIAIESPIMVENELGEILDNRYKKKYSTKAQVIYQNGSTTIENNEILTSYSVQFIIRKYHKVDETDRVIFHNKPYKINSIEHSREYQLIKLNCQMMNE